MTLFWLLVLHVLADFPLQNDFLAKAKNPMAPIPGVPWWYCLSAHALLHAGAVALVIPGAAACEFAAHAMLDYAKCRGWLGAGSRAFIVDQLGHVACKVAYVWVLA